jgi:hypothetical protein
MTAHNEVERTRHYRGLQELYYLGGEPVTASMDLSGPASLSVGLAPGLVGTVPTKPGSAPRPEKRA